MMHFVYRLHDEEGNVIYIGETENVNSRTKNHEKKHSYASYIQVESKAVGKRLEKWLIYIVKPKMNKSIPKENPKLPINWLVNNRLKYTTIR